MFQMFGGIVESVVYRGGLPFMVVPFRGERFNIYLNPGIKPELKDPVGKEMLFAEGEFSAQDNNLFFPYLIVFADKDGLSDYKLCFGF